MPASAEKNSMEHESLRRLCASIITILWKIHGSGIIGRPIREREALEKAIGIWDGLLIRGGTIKEEAEKQFAGVREGMHPGFNWIEFWTWLEGRLEMGEGKPTVPEGRMAGRDVILVWHEEATIMWVQWFYTVPALAKETWRTIMIFRSSGRKVSSVLFGWWSDSDRLSGLSENELSEDKIDVHEEA